MKKDNVFPFANPTKKLKDDFKKTIDKMDDEDFISMMYFLMESDYDEDFDCDCEECTNSQEKDYESPFSGEMINFKCKKCNKFSALEIEIVDDIYNSTQEIPSIPCFNCNSITTPVYYKSPDNKIFES